MTVVEIRELANGEWQVQIFLPSETHVFNVPSGPYARLIKEAVERMSLGDVRRFIQF